MNYEERELKARVRALIDERRVPERRLRRARARGSLGLLLSVGVLVVVVAVVVGTLLQTLIQLSGPTENPSATSTNPSSTMPSTAGSIGGCRRAPSSISYARAITSPLTTIP